MFGTLTIDEPHIAAPIVEMLDMAMRPIRGYEAPNRYPDNEYKLRHLFRNRHHNGLAPAFVKVGSRVLFDPERLESLLASQAQGIDTPSAA